MSLLHQARAAGTTAAALATALRQQAELAAPTAAEVARISAEVTRWTRAAEAMVVTSGMVAVEAAAVAEAMGGVVLAESQAAEDAPAPGPRPISMAKLHAAMAPKPGGR
jgi:ATP phosphoribosyltransferase regulatory subunit HisZ